MENIKFLNEVIPSETERICYEKFGERYKILQISDVFDKLIVFKGGEIVDTDFGQKLIIIFAFEDGGEDYMTATSGKVLIKKMKHCIDHNLFPLKGMIVKKKNYYDII